jgi:hypothetical protein
MRLIIFVAGAAMSASWALTWVEPPFAGPGTGPMDLVARGVITLSEDAPWQVWVFLSGFAAAALATVAVLMGRRPVILSLGAGLSPLVLLGDAMLRGEGLSRDLGLPVPVDFGNLTQSFLVVDEFLGLGFWIYVTAAALLILGALSLLVMRR